MLSRTSLSFQPPVPSERSVDFLDSTVPSLLFVSRCSVCTAAEKPPLPSGVSTVVFVTRNPGLSCFESSNSRCTTCSPPLASGLEIVRVPFCSPRGGLGTEGDPHNLQS